MRRSSVTYLPRHAKAKRVGLGDVLIGLALGILITMAGAGIQIALQPLLDVLVGDVGGTPELIVDLLAMVLAAALLFALTAWLAVSAFRLPPLDWRALAFASLVPLAFVARWLPAAFDGWYAPVRSVAPSLLAAVGTAIYLRSRARHAES